MTEAFEGTTPSNASHRRRRPLIGPDPAGRGPLRVLLTLDGSLQRLSDDGDAFEDLAHISHHAVVQVKGQSPAVAVAFRRRRDIDPPISSVLFYSEGLITQ